MQVSLPLLSSLMNGNSLNVALTVSGSYRKKVKLYIILIIRRMETLLFVWKGGFYNVPFLCKTEIVFYWNSVS